MENKVLLGSDLVFEFDADEVGLFSEKDVWVCDSCGAAGFGYRDRCPRCGSPVRVEIFPDEEREEKLKGMVDALIKDFLLDDFGLSREEISVNFSGNRGYHVHVRSKELRELSKEARIEIAEYITGQSINPSHLFGEAVPCGRGSPLLCVKGPSPASKGWPGRIAKSVIRVLKERDPSFLVGIVDEKVAKVILSNAPLYLSFIEKGLWPAPKLIPLTVWVDIARKTAPLSGYIIDTNTSVDIHRLIRLPNSIHGTTGLIAREVKNLAPFDPYRDAIALPSREVTVRVKIAPEFSMNGKTFGPFRDEEVQLPLYVAYYLIGRGVAEWSLTSRG